MATKEQQWFDAVGSADIEQMQQLIRDKVPLDIVNEVFLTVLTTSCI